MRTKTQHDNKAAGQAKAGHFLQTVIISLKAILIAIVLLASVLIYNAYADTTTLYEGSLNTTPDNQGWLYITDPLPPPLGPGSSATQEASGNVTNLNTNAKIGDSAGYFSNVHPLVPEFDRFTGFTISFEVQIESEFHNNNDRAGFSVIVITHDLKGIELGFWTDEIWAQADILLFTHAEGAAFETTSGLTHYRLAIVGDGYFLSADGLPILNGQLRDYTAFGSPYDIPDFLFFGDDTSSASASIKLASIAHVDRAVIVICDINGDGSVGLDDAILALQVCGGMSPSGVIPAYVSSKADVNGDGKIGLAESLCVLQTLSGLRW